jgi:hypothetical protein
VTTFGVAWCTHFKRRGLTTYGRLEWGYRAVGLFSAGFLGVSGAYVQHLTCDESFEAADFDGTRGQLADGVDVLYVAGHGEFRQHRFELILHDSGWEPSTQGLDGASGPRIAVFDACNLVDLNDSVWKATWQACTRPRLRLVCGFGSNATVGKGTTERGREFAECIDADEPVSKAWLQSVVNHSSWLQRDTAVAIGLGDDDADAKAALDATLDELLAMPDLTTVPTAVARKARR